MSYIYSSHLHNTDQAASVLALILEDTLYVVHYLVAWSEMTLDELNLTR